MSVADTFIAAYCAPAYSGDIGSSERRSSSIQPHQFDSFPVGLLPKTKARSLSEQAAVMV